MLCEANAKQPAHISRHAFITDLDRILKEFPVSQWGEYRHQGKIGGVKITSDGSPQGRTAAFTTAYLTGGPGGEKFWSGELTFPQDTINQMVKRVYDMDVPLILHASRSTLLGKAIAKSYLSSK